MSTFFPVPKERRYKDYPRRYGMEYFLDSRRTEPNVKSACATLFSARRHAADACDGGYCTTVRIFDHRTGQYVNTYKTHREDYGGAGKKRLITARFEGFEP